jgi:hypothetical protein
VKWWFGAPLAALGLHSMSLHLANRMMFPASSFQYTAFASTAMAIGFVSRAMTEAVLPVFGALMIVPTGAESTVSVRA